MAAVFYRFNDQERMYQDGFPVITSVSVPFMRKVARSDNGIITELGIRNSETIQYFLTFDDAISYFYYGKGLGELNIGGLLFADRRGRITGLQNYHDIIGRNRGQEINISIGWIGLVCILSSYSLDFMPDELLVKFGLNLTIIDHTLRQNRMEAVC